MRRTLSLWISLVSSCWLQTVAANKTFFREVHALASRLHDGQPVDPLVRLQEELAIPAARVTANPRNSHSSSLTMRYPLMPKGAEHG